jgi:uncharacterized protein involved in exopolysaccharide biosynthesis
MTNAMTQRLIDWAIRVRLRHNLVIALVVASVASCVATYAALTKTPFLVMTRQQL